MYWSFLNNGNGEGGDGVGKVSDCLLSWSTFSLELERSLHTTTSSNKIVLYVFLIHFTITLKVRFRVDPQNHQKMKIACEKSLLFD